MATLHLSICAGDPQGVGPFVSVMASDAALRADPELAITLCGSQLQIEGIINAHGLKFDAGRFAIRDVELKGCGQPPSPEGGRHALQVLDTALEVLTQGADALVTAPLSKEAVACELPNFTGHTGYLADYAKSPALMMLANEHLRVALATAHIPIHDVSETLCPDLMAAQLKLLARELRDRFGVESPRIAVLALNPHAGEGGLIGKDEELKIEPMLEQLGGPGAGFFGPFSADTFFLPGRFDQYDAVLAMYHDQGLIPVKMLGPNTTVNITLGLPFIRTSPDHGTAFDLENPAEANWQSMYHAIKEACRQAQQKGARSSLLETD
ncbi:MAG: 4-hydroxythreonine-4-phosphate dehydrogenase [Planctomycetota bacterium]